MTDDLMNAQTMNLDKVRFNKMPVYHLKVIILLEIGKDFTLSEDKRTKKNCPHMLDYLPTTNACESQYLITFNHCHIIVASPDTHIRWCEHKQFIF